MAPNLGGDRCKFHEIQDDLSGLEREGDRFSEVASNDPKQKCCEFLGFATTQTQDPF